MRSLFILGVFLFSVFANASVSVGTWATYDLAITGDDGTSLKGTEKLTAIEANATHTLLETVQVQNGNTSAEEEWQENSEIMSAADGQMLIDNCTTPEIGGVVESVTVVAGTFTACKVGNEADGFVWVGAVHYGWLKMAVNAEIEDENGNVTKFYMARELTGLSK